MPFCVAGSHDFIIDLHFGMENITPTSNQFCTNMEVKNLILQGEILLLASLANMSMMRKSIGIHFIQRETWKSGSFSPERSVNSLSVELEKMPLFMVGKCIFMIDLHSGMENIILLSNLCCMNLKSSKVQSVKTKSYRERVYSGKWNSDGLSQNLILQEGSAPSLLATSF